MTEDGAPVSRGVLVALYGAGFVGVGLVMGAAFALLRASGWDESLPSPAKAFAIGFVTGTFGTAADVVLRRNRRRRKP